jgi:hypothetical protein
MPNKFGVALQLVEEVRSLIEAAAPSPNPSVEAKVRAAMSHLGVTDSYVYEKSAKVVRFSAQYLSTRKWASHPQGAEGVRHEVLVNLRSLKEQLEYLASRGAP